MVDTPKHVYFERNRYGLMRVYFRKGKGQRFRLPDDLSSEEFRQSYAAALASIPIPHVRDMPVTPIERRKQRTEATIKGALRSAHTRARQKRVPFDIDLDYMLAMAVQQEFRCALSGIEFFAAHSWPGRVDPYTPSIDRIEPALGYVRGNVRIVIYAVNAMLLDWGESLFVQIANSYRYWSRTKNAQPKPPLLYRDPHHIKKTG